MVNFTFDIVHQICLSICHNRPIFCQKTSMGRYCDINLQNGKVAGIFDANWDRLLNQVILCCLS